MVTNTDHTGTQARDPNEEEVRVGYPAVRLHLPLLPAPGAALMVHLPEAEQWRLAGSGHLDGGSRQGKPLAVVAEGAG